MSKKETPPIGYTPPSSPEAEQSTLGAILVRPEVLDEVIGIITPEDFYREAHGKIFTAMVGLYNQSEPVDLVTVCARLKEAGWLESCGGPVFMAELSEQVGFATNAQYYAGIVKKMSQLRKLLDASQKIAGACLAPVEDVAALLDQAEENIYLIKDDQSHSTVFTLDELVPQEITKIEKVFERKQETTGIPSGFLFLDNLTGGWQNSDLIILAARPSMGKTALALNIAKHAAMRAQVPTAFFSLEQPKEQLVQRMLANTGRINATRIRSARMIPDEWAKLYEAGGALAGVPLHIIDQSSMSPMELRSHARRLKSRHNIGLIIIDYLQLMALAKPKSREAEVSLISRSLKRLAKELQIPVIALAQLSRECERRPNKRPMLSDLRESGSIEQDADLVIFIYRDELYRENSPDAGKAEVKVAKQRNGPTGTINLAYQAEFMSFSNLAEGMV